MTTTRKHYFIKKNDTLTLTVKILNRIIYTPVNTSNRINDNQCDRTEASF